MLSVPEMEKIKVTQITDTCFTCADDVDDKCSRDKEQHPTGCFMYCRKMSEQADVIFQNGNEVGDEGE